MEEEGGDTGYRTPGTIWLAASGRSNRQTVVCSGEQIKQGEEACSQQTTVRSCNRRTYRRLFRPRDDVLKPGRLIRDRLSFLHERHIYFFVDDYSHPKITKALQVNLNRLVMHRSPDVFFKLSTESPISFAREDVDGKQYVESREYDLLNLGLRYISSDPKHTLEFLKDLFARRFQEVEKYPVKNLEELVGSMARNENETARAFRAKCGRENYAGTETIAAMCSGDIHYMIRLVGSMVEDFGGRVALAKTATEPRIPRRKQHESYSHCCWFLYGISAYIAKIWATIG